MTIEILTQHTINNFIATSESPVIIDYWGYGCPPCKAIQPILEEMAENKVTILSFGKINLDENEEVASWYGLRSVPTLIIFNLGREIERLTVPSVSELREKLSRYSNK